MDMMLNMMLHIIHVIIPFFLHSVHMINNFVCLHIVNIMQLFCALVFKRSINFYTLNFFILNLILHILANVYNMLQHAKLK
jgi:hypothetical protein